MKARQPFVYGFLLALTAFICMGQSSMPFIIRGLPIEGSPDGANDYVPIFDASSGLQKRATVSSIGGGGGVPATESTQFATNAANEIAIPSGVLLTNAVVNSGTLTIPDNAISLVSGTSSDLGLELETSGTQRSVLFHGNSQTLWHVKNDSSTDDATLHIGDILGGTDNVIVNLRGGGAAADYGAIQMIQNLSRRHALIFTNDGASGLDLKFETYNAGSSYVDTPLIIPQTGAIEVTREINSSDKFVGAFQMGTAAGVQSTLITDSSGNLQEDSDTDLIDIRNTAASSNGEMLIYTNGTWSITSDITAVPGTADDFELIIACSDETSDLTTGTAKATFRMPRAVTLTAVRASATTAPTGATLTVDINESGTTILSTKLTIDATEKTSTTAATAAVISDSSLADDAEITIDIDQIGSTVAGAGLKVTLIGNRN